MSKIKDEMLRIEEGRSPYERTYQVDYRPLSEIYPEVPVYGRDAAKDEWYDNHPNFNRHD